jgi:hypothetical protein
MRLHSLLLYLYPSSFRHEYGEELSHIFSERRQQSGNGFSVIWLWITEIIDVIKNASPAHWDILRQDLRYGLRTPVLAALRLLRLSSQAWESAQIQRLFP